MQLLELQRRKFKGPQDFQLDFGGGRVERTLVTSAGFFKARGCESSPDGCEFIVEHKEVLPSLRIQEAKPAIRLTDTCELDPPIR